MWKAVSQAALIRQLHGAGLLMSVAWPESVTPFLQTQEELDELGEDGEPGDNG